MAVIECAFAWFRTGLDLTSQTPATTNSKKDRHLTHMALMDGTVMPRILSHEMGSFARQEVSMEIVRQHLYQYEMSAR